MKLILVLGSLFILFFSGCVPKRSDYKPNPANGIVDELERKVLLQLKKEKNLQPFEFGGGAGKNPITFMHWGFAFYQGVDIGKARELLLAATDQFLAEINSNECIRPYLRSYPFKPEGLGIKIFFFNPDGSLLPSEKLSIVSIKNGALRYKIAVPSPGLPLTTIYQETYEEARAKLEKKNSQPSMEDEVSRDDIFPP